MFLRTVLILLILLPAAPTPAADDLWAPFRPLEGRWKGKGEGFGSTSRVRHTWEWVAKGAFLALHTDSRGDGEMHEDIGFVSRDRDNDRWMFRQFLSEGFVNVFEVVPGRENGLPVYEFDFVAAESAGSMQVRMRFVFTSPDTYTATLELAGEGGDHAPCQVMTMTRYMEEDR